MMVAFGRLNKLPTSFQTDTSTTGQRPRKMDLKRLKFSTFTEHHSDSTMIQFIGRSLHANVVVRHWNTLGNIEETFPNGLCRKPNRF